MAPTYASLMLAFGRVGDIFGHARVFRAGLAWSVAAFLLCAAAPSYGVLLFCRFLQGIGAGLVISVAPARRRRPAGFGASPQPRRRGVHDDFCAGFGVRAARRRRARRPLGLALPCSGSRADRLCGTRVFARIAAPRRAGRNASRSTISPGAVPSALAISTLLLAGNQAPRLGGGNWLALPLVGLAASGFGVLCATRPELRRRLSISACSGPAVLSRSILQA